MPTERRVLGLLACVVALAGCAGADRSKEPPRPRGHLLTVYSSLPASGVSASAAGAVAAGERLALAEANSEAGRFRLRLVQLDSTRPGGLLWDPSQVTANASRAGADPRAIAYVGDLDYGASAVSLPGTNERGLLQVSPEDGLTSLTSSPPGANPGDPDRYYPSHRRSFVRLVPSDLDQLKALLRMVRTRGFHRPAVVSDNGIYGLEMAKALDALARRAGPTPVLNDQLEGGEDAEPGLVGRLRDSRADAVLYVGAPVPVAGSLLAGLARALPRVPVLGVEGLSALPPRRVRAAPRRVEAISAMLPRAAYPRPARSVLRRIARRAGRRAARPDALYGYEAMRLVIHAVRRGGDNRLKVVRAALGGHPGRDTGRFAVLRLRGRRFEPEAVLP